MREEGSEERGEEELAVEVVVVDVAHDAPFVVGDSGNVLVPDGGGVEGGDACEVGEAAEFFLEACVMLVSFGNAEMSVVRTDVGGAAETCREENFGVTPYSDLTDDVMDCLDVPMVAYAVDDDEVGVVAQDVTVDAVEVSEKSAGGSAAHGEINGEFGFRVVFHQGEAEEPVVGIVGNAVAKDEDGEGFVFGKARHGAREIFLDGGALCGTNGGAGVRGQSFGDNRLCFAACDTLEAQGLDMKLGLIVAAADDNRRGGCRGGWLEEGDSFRGRYVNGVGGIAEVEAVFVVVAQRQKPVGRCAGLLRLD